MSATTGTTPAKSYDWASILDQEDATLTDLANAVDELAIPITACREVIDNISGGELDDPPEFVPSLAIALVALLDKVQSKRERLQAHLHRLAESDRTTAPPSP
jgi:hypothetical protein